MIQHIKADDTANDHDDEEEWPLLDKDPKFDKFTTKEFPKGEEHHIARS
jgi:hypothetical protein